MGEIWPFFGSVLSVNSQSAYFSNWGMPAIFCKVIAFMLVFSPTITLLIVE